MKWVIVVAWHNELQHNEFLRAWNVTGNLPDYLVMQQDKTREGCAVTKNKGIARARERDPEVIIVLDDDCYPTNARMQLTHTSIGPSLETFAQEHIAALEPQEVELFEAVTDPPSRGTPYFNRTVKMPVAASMGFWTENPDYDAVSSLVYRRNDPLPTYHKKPIFWRFFPLSGMNLAWKDKEWGDLAKFVNVPRFDDVWMGYPWEREAYFRGHCFNLNGPMVRHIRQSDVWNNLRIEAASMEENEIRWQQYAPPAL